MNTRYQTRLKAAFSRAVELHASQKRKGSGVPYLIHLIGVASIVMENHGNPDEVIAGLLHDAVEDAGGKPTLLKIQKEFGKKVAAIVEGCTDTATTPKPPWRKRKESYIAHVRNASRSVQLVSSADKLHNLRSILTDYKHVGEKLWNIFKGGKEGTLWYYRSLIEAFNNGGRTAIVDELDTVYAALLRAISGSEQDKK